jgi:hypothetical protein
LPRCKVSTWRAICTEFCGWAVINELPAGSGNGHRRVEQPHDGAPFVLVVAIISCAGRRIFQQAEVALVVVTPVLDW